jgi:hypothetical protein
MRLYAPSDFKSVPYAPSDLLASLPDKSGQAMRSLISFAKFKSGGNYLPDLKIRKSQSFERAKASEEL